VFGQRIGLKEEGDKIVKDVSFVIKRKNTPPTFFLNVGSQSGFGQR
jgi:hypothetical protein